MRTLDLHGMTHHAAESACHRFINNNWGEELRIITGNSTMMKEIVCQVLIFYKLDFTLDNPRDMGYIIVRK